MLCVMIFLLWVDERDMPGRRVILIGAGANIELNPLESILLPAARRLFLWSRLLEPQWISSNNLFC